MRYTQVIVVAFIFTLVFGYSLLFAQVKPVADVDLIRMARKNFNDSISSHDANRITEYLDHDYQITTGNGEHYRGTPKEEAQVWAEIFENKADIVYVRSTEAIEVSSVNLLAAENGRWVGRWTSNNGNVEVGGSYFAQWRKVEGTWRIRSEIFVTLYCKGHDC